MAYDFLSKKKTKLVETCDWVELSWCKPKIRFMSDVGYICLYLPLRVDVPNLFQSLKK